MTNWTTESDAAHCKWVWWRDNGGKSSIHSLRERERECRTNYHYTQDAKRLPAFNDNPVKNVINNNNNDNKKKEDLLMHHMRTWDGKRTNRKAIENDFSTFCLHIDYTLQRLLLWIFPNVHILLFDCIEWSSYTAARLYINIVYRCSSSDSRRKSMELFSHFFLFLEKLQRWAARVQLEPVDQQRKCGMKLLGYRKYIVEARAFCAADDGAASRQRRRRFNIHHATTHTRDTTERELITHESRLSADPTQ